MDDARNEFLHRCNVESYTRRLRHAVDVDHRAMLMTLLAEEVEAARANGWSPLVL